MRSSIVAALTVTDITPGDVNRPHIENVRLPARGESYQTDRSSAIAIEWGTHHQAQARDSETF